QAGQHPAAAARARRGSALLGTRARAGTDQRHRPHEPGIAQASLLMSDLSDGAVDDAVGDFRELTRKISVERGFGCASYKEKCLRRRIAVRMRARGVHTYDDYARILDTDAAEYERLLDALTINVTKLFRNWSVYEAIAEHVIPALWKSETAIHVWAA